MMPSLRLVSLALSLFVLPLTVACASPSIAEDVDESEDPLRTTYGDLVETLDAPQLERWMAVRAELASGFERACDEALCGRGEYTKLTTVRLACSSTRAARKLKDCVWVLGGNVDHVDAASGVITSDLRVWTCHVPVAGRAGVMLDALEAAGAGAFQANLPGTQGSFADALAACVVEGTVAPPAPASTTGSFADLGAERWAAGDGPGATWAAVEPRLNARFDDACGDTFCEGDYPDVVGLGFSCAVDRTNDRVATCAWSFAAADTAVDSRGHITAGTKTTRCTVPVDAQTADVAGALAGEDPLHAPLPGRATSIYDALVECL